MGVAKEAIAPRTFIGPPLLSEEIKFSIQANSLLQIIENKEELHRVNMMFLNSCFTLTFLSFFVSFVLPCKQQFVVNSASCICATLSSVIIL